MRATGTWMLVVMFVGLYFGLSIGWRLAHNASMEAVMPKREVLTPVQKLAWAIHRKNGHHPKYTGPCWGPTQKELAEAKRRLAHNDGAER